MPGKTPATSGTWDVLSMSRLMLLVAMSDSLLCLHFFKKLYLKIFLAVPCGTWDLSSLTRDRTCAHCIGRVES